LEQWKLKAILGPLPIRHPIAHADFGQKKTRPDGIGFQLAAEAGHEDAQVMVLMTPAAR